MSEHLRADYDRMVGESYKEYATRMRGRMLAAEHDRDAFADEVRRLREQQAILADPAASLAELVELRAMRERARALLANPDEDEAWQHAVRHILGDL